ncbi:MAG: sigma-70 family RNA polymerase sigma factor [Solirubrobacteraceae bacterium]
MTTHRVTQDRGISTARERLLIAAQLGDPKAQEELVRRYEPLVQRVVWKLRLPPGCDREDLAQEARVGLLAAVRAWRPDRGPFPAFADRCVSNQVLLALKATSARKHQVLSLAASLDAPLDHRASSSDSRPAPALLDTLPARRDTRTDPEIRLLVQEQITSVLRALPTLTDSERAGLAMALNGHSPTRLAPTLAGSPHAASQAAQRARRKLAAAVAQAA